MPVSEICRLTGESVKATDCRGLLDRQAFETAYCQYIEWHTESGRECALYSSIIQPAAESVLIFNLKDVIQP